MSGVTWCRVALRLGTLVAVFGLLTLAPLNVDGQQASVDVGCGAISHLGIHPVLGNLVADQRVRLEWNVHTRVRRVVFRRCAAGCERQSFLRFLVVSDKSEHDAIAIRKQRIQASPEHDGCKWRVGR